MIPESQLLKRYAEVKDEDAFRELVSKYIKLVYSTAVRQLNGDTHLAQDVTQTVFAALAKEAKTLRTETVLGSWLYRRACFVAANIVRAEIRRRHREERGAEMTLTHEDSQPESKQLTAFLDEAIQRLGTVDRDAIILRFFEGRDLRTVGACLGTSEEAAKKRVARALDKLRLLLKKRGCEVTTASLGGLLAACTVEATPVGLVEAVGCGAMTAGSALAVNSGSFLLKAMTSTMFKLVLSGGILSAILAPTLVLQHREIIKLRAQNDELKRQQASIRDSQPQQAFAETDKANENDSDKLQSELLRLRGEVTQLKRAADENKVQSKTKSEDTLGKYTTKKEWLDSGASEPGAALETILWAAHAGNENRIKEMIQVQVMGISDVNHVNFNWDQTAPKVIEDMKNFVDRLQGAQILTAEPLSEQTTHLRLELTDSSNKKQVQDVMMTRQDSGWKIALTFKDGESKDTALLNDPAFNIPLTANSPPASSP